MRRGGSCCRSRGGGDTDVVFHKKFQSISTNDFSWRLNSHCGGQFLSGMVRDKCYALKHTEVISGSFATHRTLSWMKCNTLNLFVAATEVTCGRTQRKK